MTGTDRCPACAFAAADWNAMDAGRTFTHLAMWWSEVSGRDAADAGLPVDRWAAHAAALEGGAPLIDQQLDELHGGLHTVSEAGRRVHEAGRGAPTQHGEVAAVNASNGGVPKQPVLQGVVGWRGLEGDSQAARRHHGRPWQALCLWSADVISRLQGEGHPIAAGSAGENLTVAGINWATLRPGTRVQAGDVLAEISLWAVPCKKNAQWFAGGDFNRMSHQREPGVTRWYATVLRPGRVSPGDPFVVEPG